MRLPVIILLVIHSIVTCAQRMDFSTVDFARADSIAHAHWGDDLADLPRLANVLTSSLQTDVEKFRSIYVWVCHNLAFDFELFHLSQTHFEDPEKFRKWNKKLKARVFRNLIQNKATICTGYAWLVSELAAQANISCTVINGYGRSSGIHVRKLGSPNHSWNAVRLNGKWYLCDPTWSSGSADAKLERFERNFNDVYFLPEPELFVRNHYPLEPSWTLLNQNNTSEISDTLSEHKSLTVQDFINRPVIYSSAYTFNLTKLYPETFEVETLQGEAIPFSFSSSGGAIVKKAELSVYDGSGASSQTSDVARDVDGRYQLTHTFHNAGNHTVHVLLNNRYAYTYRVTVK